MTDANLYVEVAQLRRKVRELEGRIHALEYPNYCYTCQQNFPNADALEQHRKATGNGDDPI